MGLLRGPDFFYAIRFLRLLTTKWTNTSAFKLGIIDTVGGIGIAPQKLYEFIGCLIIMFWRARISVGAEC